MSDKPIDRERWQRIEAILDQVLELPAADRRARLEAACAGNPDLRAEVEALLAADEEADGVLETPVGEYAAMFLDDASPAARHLRSEVPRSVGPYEVLRQIGSGGMGVVYEARDSRLGRTVALKFLPREWGGDPAAKERFLREARAASALDQPNICTIHDLGELDGGRQPQLYIVMAYYPGETLKAKLERGPLPVAAARDLAIQVARGLERAHEAGITHRDVKPANVMVTERGEVKILDFGIAKIAGDAGLTRSGSSLGTPYYMSPEQASGESVDERTDLWSLGAMLYEMLAGRRPFEGGNQLAVVHAIVHRQPGPLEELRGDVPEALARTVAKLLAKDPAERYQSAAELLADLETGQASARSGVPRSGVPAVEVSAPSQIARAARRRRRWPWLLAAAALAAASLAAWWLRPPPPPLYVAVTEPLLASAEGPDGQALVAAGVHAAVLQGLAGLRGIAAVSTDSLEAEPESPTAAAQALAADEVLESRLDCGLQRCQLALRRLAGADGRMLGIESFEVPTDDLQLVASVVVSHLGSVFGSFRPRAGGTDAALSAESYAEFLRLRQRLETTGGVDDRELLDRLAALRAEAPEFLEVYLVEARAARVSFSVSRDPSLLERGFEILARARDLAPFDPRVFFQLFDLAKQTERWDVAEEALAALKAIDPGHAGVLQREAKMQAHLGRREEALSLMRKAARFHPSFKTIFDLAWMENDQGEFDAARRTLETLLERVPSSSRGRSLLAQIELLNGSPVRAAELYRQLVDASPGVIQLSNLGLAYMLLGRFEEAAESYRQAYELQPGSPIVTLNLADASLLLQEVDVAESLYRRTIELLDTASTAAGRQELTIRAQALARLGRSREAAAAIQRALSTSPDHPQVAFEAALVYTLVGDRSSALVNVERALRLGFDTRWFTLAWFDELRTDEGFRQLVEIARNP